jgi:hypothetical protein
VKDRLYDEAGLVGKVIILWVLILAVLALAAVDTASIAFTTYKLSDVGSQAASEGARTFDHTHDIRDTCERVARVVQKEDPEARLTKRGCRVRRPSGLVTVAIRKRANTIVAHRIPWTERFALVVVKETAGPPSL